LTIFESFKAKSLLLSRALTIIFRRGFMCLLQGFSLEDMEEYPLHFTGEDDTWVEKLTIWCYLCFTVHNSIGKICHVNCIIGHTELFIRCKTFLSFEVKCACGCSSLSVTTATRFSIPELPTNSQLHNNFVFVWLDFHKFLLSMYMLPSILQLG
jgi:hypothetical protein